MASVIPEGAGNPGNDEAKKRMYDMYCRNPDLQSDPWTRWLGCKLRDSPSMCIYTPADTLSHMWTRLLPTRVFVYRIVRAQRKAGEFRKPVVWFEWPHYLDMYGQNSPLPPGRIRECDDVEKALGPAFGTWVRQHSDVNWDRDLILVQSVKGSSTFVSQCYDGELVLKDEAKQRRLAREQILEKEASGSPSPTLSRTREAAGVDKASDAKDTAGSVKVRATIEVNGLEGTYARVCAWHECGKTEPKPRDFPLCSKCRVVTYCSRDCQRKDWSIHKQFCG